MPSVDSAIETLLDVKHNILIMMQEGDTEEGFGPSLTWANEMYHAWELLGETIKVLDTAKQYG